MCIKTYDCIQVRVRTEILHIEQFEYQNILTKLRRVDIMSFKEVFCMFEQVKTLIVEELGVEEDAVTMDANIIDDLGADSLDVVELIMALEDAFDITVSDSEAQKLKTVKDVIDYIEKVK